MPEHRRLLCVFAHPDDETLGAGSRNCGEFLALAHTAGAQQGIARRIKRDRRGHDGLRSATDGSRRIPRFVNRRSAAQSEPPTSKIYDGCDDGALILLA
jgi:hypothetical protein